MTVALRAMFNGATAGTSTTRRALVLAVVRGVLAVAFVSTGVAPVAHAQATDGPSLIVLVRHAEKATETGSDPNLSAAGVERANALLEALTNLQPSAVIVTATKRTAQTAAPVATRFGITPQVVSLAGGGATHVNAVADAVRRQRGIVVVVGHSNTIPAIVKALGGPALPDLCDSAYSTLFVLQPGRDGKAAALVRASYGAPDGPTAGCPAMTPAR